ncbi:hypothetical protein [Faecalibacillus faecis]|uniref:hypothetical protein n=1 Tax=Faecalibacillus faecis TaxID=1982628 RepID=UPI003865D8DE
MSFRENNRKKKLKIYLLTFFIYALLVIAAMFLLHKIIEFRAMHPNYPPITTNEG